MRALDARLLHRARAARVALGADAVLGIVAALLVLAQAVLLARVVARSFDGASLEEVATPLTLLLVVVVARAAATWGFETIGTHAAAGVVSQLRLDLVGSRLKGNPTALDGAESAEVATAAVSGVEALEGLFGRYLPQLVLAAVVPVAVLILVASLDLVSAGLMLLTLPLVPVFFWLIGRTTGARARERWEAMSLLSTHFLDVVRGLPTLRAFNRGEAQAARIEQVSDEYRRTTMGTLRLAFLSGTVLELAATLGVALVAVTVGVRLVNGGISFEPALTVLVLAPELYLPLRNLAAGFHASADGAAVADRLLELIEQPVAVMVGTQPPPSVREAAIRFESVSFSYPGRLDPGSLRRLADDRARRDGRPGRPERRWEVHARDDAAALPPARIRPDRRRRHRPRLVRTRSLAPADRLGAPGSDAVSGHDRRQHPARRPGRIGRARARGSGAGRGGRSDRPASRGLRDDRR